MIPFENIAFQNEYLLKLWNLHLIHSPMFLNTSCCLYVRLWLIPCVLKFQIAEVQSCSDDSPVKFSSEVVFYVDRYEIV